MSTSSRSIRRISALAATVISTSALIAPTTATAPTPVYVDARPPTSQTITYGSYWGMTFRTEQDLRLWQPSAYEVEGLPGGPDDFYFSSYEGPGFLEYFLQVGPKSALLDAGEYQVGVSFSGNRLGTDFVGITRIPHSLIVEPAELVTDVRVAPDRADSQNTVVSMRLSGRWIDELYGAYRSAEGQAQLDEILAPPAGRWSMTIRDGAGAALVEEQFDLDRGDVPAVSFLWRGAPIAEPVTVEAAFTPSSEEAGNFTVVAAAPISFTTGQESRPAITEPVVADTPVTTSPAAGSVALPLWSLVLAAVAGLGAAITAVIIAARGRRRRADATTDGDDGEPEPHDEAQAESSVDAGASPADDDESGENATNEETPA